MVQTGDKKYSLYALQKKFMVEECTTFKSKILKKNNVQVQGNVNQYIMMVDRCISSLESIEKKKKQRMPVLFAFILEFF